MGQRAALKALLIQQPVELSRISPLFEPAHRGAPEIATPLADPHLSRTPCILRPSGTAIVVDPNGQRLVADGHTLTQPTSFDAAALARGVVLELSQRVALLLHRHSCRPVTDVARLLGQSDAIEDVRRELLRVADLDTPVLIRGETGTGKELVAQAIHEHSPRKARAYVAVNMATVPESMGSTVLFGHVKGAFTGAQQRHQGLFERASGGTLLLDEIGDTPETVQPMLLRAIETGLILPLGDTRELRVDVRLIAATDADLEEELRARSFSGALLHRLAGYEIRIPPMRERRDDIALLLLSFVRAELEKNGELDRLAQLTELLATSGFMARVVRHPLPGNVRQIRNIARHLVISNRHVDALAIAASVERLLADGAVPDALPVGAPSAAVDQAPQALDDARVLRALRDNGWSPTRAAASLRIPTGTLHDWMRKSTSVRRAADLDDAELRAASAACGGDVQAMADRLCVSERALRLTLRQRGMLDG